MQRMMMSYYCRAVVRAPTRSSSSTTTGSRRSVLARRHAHHHHHHHMHPSSLTPLVLRTKSSNIRVSKRRSFASTSGQQQHQQNNNEEGLSMLGKIFFGSLCGGTFILGCWQTQRLFEKQTLVKQRDYDLQQVPITISNCNTTTQEIKRLFRKRDDIIDDDDDDDTATSNNDNNNFRRYKIRGKFQHDKEFVVGPRGPPAGALPDKPGSSSAGMSSAPQGYYIITPFEIEVASDDDNSSSTTTTKTTATTKTTTTTRIFNYFSKKEPEPSKKEEEEEDVAMATQVVLVNRGWVPRNMVMSDNKTRRGAPARGGRPRQQQQQPVTTPTTTLHQWNRPSGTVEIIAVPTKPEVPKFLVAGHDVKEKPAILFWYDWPAMLAVGGISLNPDNVDGSTSSLRPLIMTAVQSDNDDGDNNDNNKKKPAYPPMWPVQPTASKVGEFKVSPAVHAGYACTWFGLSAAGVYMTKKLITRGRG